MTLSYLDSFVPSKRAMRSLENPSLPLNDVEAWEDAGLLVSRTKSGIRVTHKKALGHAPVWRGINLIARTVGRLRAYVYRNRGDGGRERDKEHLAYSLLRRKPNRFLTPGTFLKTLTYHAVFYGNGYALTLRDRLGRLVPVEKGGGLIILSPFDTVPFQRNGEVWYQTTINGKQEFIPAADTLHIKALSHDGLVGHGIIEVLAEALAVGISSRDYAARFFGQGSSASGILMIPGHLKKDAQLQAIKDFERIASGIKNQHRIALLQDDVRWQPMTINPEQSQMLQSQDFDLRVVANVLCLPPHKLGDVTRQGYASLEQENQAFLDDSIDPWLVTWEEELEDKLLTDTEKSSDSHLIEFNRNALLKTDALTRTRIYTMRKQWGLDNTNDIRRRENEEPIGPAGDVYWAPANMVPIDQLGKEPAKPEQAPAQNQDQIRSAAIDAVMERLTHLAKVEAEHAQRAAARETNFVEWIERYYLERAAKYDEVLTPLVRVWAAAIGRKAKGFVEGVAMELSHRLIDRAKERLLTIAGRCSPAQLPHEIPAIAGIDEGELRQILNEVLGTH